MLNTAKLSERLLDVNILLLNDEDDCKRLIAYVKKPILRRRFPPTLPLRTLRNLLQKPLSSYLKNSSLSRAVFFRYTKSLDTDEFFCFEMENELRDLGFYDIKSGDSILIALSMEAADGIRRDIQSKEVPGSLLRDM